MFEAKRTVHQNPLREKLIHQSLMREPLMGYADFLNPKKLRMRKVSSYLGWGLLVFLAIGVGGYALSYLNFDLDYGLLRQKPEDIKASLLWRIAFYTHVTGGSIALVAGAFQFPEWMRRKVNVHRALGKLYLLAIGFGGVAGLAVAIFTEGGIIAQTGFSFLAIVWLSTSWLAYTSVRSRDFETHREWMLRSYAACCAAITLRFILPFELAALQMDFNTAYQIVAWACWVPNMIVIEWYIRSQKQVQLT